MTHPEAAHVRYDVTDRVATVTLHRPEKLNALTPGMEQDYLAALAHAGQDPDVRAVVVTGAGRGFCAGADLSLLEGLAGGQLPAGRRRATSTDALGLAKPLIAAVNGPVAGLGLAHACFADLRFAAASATFTTAFARLGLIAEWGLAALLPRLVGQGHAADLLLSARSVDAGEALAMGLVCRVLPDADLLGAAQEWAARVAATCAPRSLAMIKAQLAAGAAPGLGAAIALAQPLMLASFATPDFAEGVRALQSRRPPEFPGWSGGLPELGP